MCIITKRLLRVPLHIFVSSRLSIVGIVHVYELMKGLELINFANISTRCFSHRHSSLMITRTANRNVMYMFRTDAQPLPGCITGWPVA